MVLKLYGSAMSTSRVLVTLLEKDLAYEFILVDIAKGAQKTEEYKRLQPFGKVPVLDDDGFIIYESRAICKYLARKLVPDDDEAYGRFEEACSIEQSYFATAAETIGTELVIKPYVYPASGSVQENNQQIRRMKGLCAPDMDRVAQAEQDLDSVLAVYDSKLTTQRYIAGDEITLADLFHLPNAAALTAGKWKEVFERYPNVNKWLEGLRGRETWKRAAEEARTIP